MERREFIKNALVTVGALSSGFGLDRSAGAEEATTGEPPARNGRMVRAVSIGFRPGPSLDKIAELAGGPFKPLLA